LYARADKKKKLLTMRYGYARVSTVEQETTLQLDALRRAGVERVFSEKASAVKRRPQLAALLREVTRGDSLVVYRLDRLARSLRDLLVILEHLERTGCALLSVTEAVDTQTLAGRMMLQMLGAIAEFERGLIRERTKAGIRAAMDRGKQIGRPRSVSPEIEAQLVELIESRTLGYRECAELFGVEQYVVSNAVYRARLARGAVRFRTRNALTGALDV
jgi:DNA invertase Pin-like site-specific DNA recombinase